MREGLDETLTIVKLGVTGSLRAFFCTANAIENVMGSVRDVTANVKRWGKGDMLKRWIGLSFMTAAKRFRRIKGYKSMSMLVAALESREQAVSVDSKSKAA